MKVAETAGMAIRMRLWRRLDGGRRDAVTGTTARVATARMQESARTKAGSLDAGRRRQTTKLAPVAVMRWSVGYRGEDAHERDSTDLPPGNRGWSRMRREGGEDGLA